MTQTGEGAIAADRPVSVTVTVTTATCLAFNSSPRSESQAKNRLSQHVCYSEAINRLSQHVCCSEGTSSSFFSKGVILSNNMWNCIAVISNVNQLTIN
jgi:hypothetical protein